MILWRKYCISWSEDRKKVVWGGDISTRRRGNNREEEGGVGGKEGWYKDKERDFKFSHFL